MKKVFYFTCMTMLFAACSKTDKMTTLEAWLYNNSSHSILILPYKSGIVLASDTIRLSENDSLQYGLSSDWGDITGPGFYSEYSGGPDDSIIVIYDDIYKISHYANTPVNLAIKYYLFDSKRNIMNPLSYEFSRIENKNESYTNMHKYRFTEQDYLDAKD